MKASRNEIRLSGSGGQGLITAGIILARAALYDNYRVTQSQSYGPESRGGSSRADVIISNDDIHYPEATQFDILMALTQEACDVYAYDLKDSGLLITDSGLVKNLALTVDHLYEVPFTQLTIEKLGSELPTNIVSLAFLVKVSQVVSEESLAKALEYSIKPAFLELNLKAMRLGMELGTEALKGKS